MSRRLLPLLLFFTTLSAFGDDAALFTLYKTRVAPIIQGTCIGCHVSGGAASSTRLVYASGSSTSVQEANFRLVRSYIEGNIKTGSQYTFLNKGQGQQGHVGGNQLRRAEDVQAVTDFIDAIALSLSDGDEDGVTNDLDNCQDVANADQADLDQDGKGDVCDADIDGDGVANEDDDFPKDATETQDSDQDGVGDVRDAFPDDPNEFEDTDGDGRGDVADPDDDDDGFSDAQELADGTNPKSRFSCPSCAFSFDVDESQTAQALTDGLLVIRHLFGFSGDALTAGAVAGLAGRAASEDITVFLTDADAELDIDGNGKSEPLTDGLLLIRYLFGFSGDALIAGAIGSGAARNTAEAVEAYIEARVPLQ